MLRACVCVCVCARARARARSVLQIKDIFCFVSELWYAAVFFRSASEEPKRLGG